MATQRDRQKDFDEAYQQSWAHWSRWQQQARSDLTVYAGDPWTAQDKRLAKLTNRELMSFPQLRRVVKWLTGWEREHRLSITYDPMENGDMETASQLNMVALWALQWQNGYHVASDAFEGALKTGMNLLNIYNDRNLNTCFERFMYNQFLLDPTFTRVDLKDCHFGIMRKYVTGDAARMLLPGKESLINTMLKQDTSQGTSQKFSLYRKPSLYGRKLLSYDEFQQRDTRKVFTLIFRPTGEEVPFQKRGNLEDYIRRMVMAGAPPEMLTVRQDWIPTVTVSVFLNEKEVSHSTDPFDVGDFSFVPVIAYFDPDMEHSDEQVQSVIRGHVDSQRASDRMMIAMKSWVEQQAGAGLDYEQGALMDDEDAFTTGSGKPRVFTKGALENNRARDRVVPDIPLGMFKLFEEQGDGLLKRIGIAPDMIGFPSGSKGNVRVSGGLAKLRMNAGLITFRDLFDNREISMKMMGTRLLRLIQQYPGYKVARITNRPASDAFYKDSFGKYDAAVAEGTHTDTQRALAYAELMAMKELGHKMGDPAPISWKRLVEVSPIQQPLELIKEIEQTEKQQQAHAEKQQQLNEALQQLAIAQAQAEIAQQKALTQQQITGAMENQAETALDRVKTAAEIQELQGKGSLEVLKMAVDLEKARIGASKRDNSR
ncbi:MAG: portal protein [Planctomycetota bacterium]|jgi:hypothetical protein